MRIDVGTSGYGYKEWIGSFYPPDMKPKGMLAYYAQNLSTVEINYTFRRMPTPSLLEGWARQVPDSFTFVLKAPERITHRAKLKDVGETTKAFVSAAQTLGPRLGALLFQLPPYAKKDVGVLREFSRGSAGGRARRSSSGTPRGSRATPSTRCVHTAPRSASPSRTTRTPATS